MGWDVDDKIWCNNDVCLDVASLMLVVVVASSKQPFYLFYFSASLIVVRFKLGSAMMMASQGKAQHHIKHCCWCLLSKHREKTVFLTASGVTRRQQRQRKIFLTARRLFILDRLARTKMMFCRRTSKPSNNHKVIIVGTTMAPVTKKRKKTNKKLSALSQCWKRDVRKMNSPKTKAKE